MLAVALRPGSTGLHLIPGSESGHPVSHPPDPPWLPVPQAPPSPGERKVPTEAFSEAPGFFGAGVGKLAWPAQWPLASDL